jgi:hypothetical protein
LAFPRAGFPSFSPAKPQKLFSQKLLLSRKQDQEVEVLENKEMAAKHMLLGAILERTGEASFMELARAYEIISRAPINRNPILSPGQNIFSGTIVQISVPARSLPEIQITKDKEVIAIGERALAPLPAAQVTNLFSRMRGEQNEQICLPSGPEESDSGSLSAGNRSSRRNQWLKNRKLEMIRRRPWLCQLSFRRIFLFTSFFFLGRSPRAGTYFSSFAFFSFHSQSPFLAEHPTMEILPWLRQSFSDVSSAPAPRFPLSSGPKTRNRSFRHGRDSLQELLPQPGAPLCHRNYSEQS